MVLSHRQAFWEMIPSGCVCLHCNSPGKPPGVWKAPGCGGRRASVRRGSAGTRPVGAARAGSSPLPSRSPVRVLLLVKDPWLFVLFAESCGLQPGDAGFPARGGVRARSARALAHSSWAAPFGPGAAQRCPFEVLPCWLPLTDVYVKSCGWGT